MDAINAEVIGPSGPVYLDFDLGPDGGRGYFQPDEIGMHELFVTNEGEAVKGSPHYLRSMPKSKKDYDGKLPTKGLSKILFSATFQAYETQPRVGKITRAFTSFYGRIFETPKFLTLLH